MDQEQVVKNCYAPIVHRCIVIVNRYYRTLTVAARAGMGIKRRIPFVGRLLFLYAMAGGRLLLKKLDK